MKDRRKRRGHLWGTLLVVWFCLCSMGLPAAAQEQIRLIKGSAAGADAAKIQAELPFSSTYKVYRADRSPEAGGVFRLVDIFDAGSRWISLKDVYKRQVSVSMKETIRSAPFQKQSGRR